MSSQTCFSDTLDPEDSVHAPVGMKDEYSFAFREL